jgi:hypothetical protein
MALVCRYTVTVLLEQSDPVSCVSTAEQTAVIILSCFQLELSVKFCSEMRE